MIISAVTQRLLSVSSVFSTPYSTSSRSNRISFSTIKYILLSIMFRIYVCRCSKFIYACTRKPCNTHRLYYSMHDFRRITSSSEVMFFFSKTKFWLSIYVPTSTQHKVLYMSNICIYMCVWQSERERERESVCVCVFVCVCVHVCVCVYIYVNWNISNSLQERNKSSKCLNNYYVISRSIFRMLRSELQWKVSDNIVII